MLESDSLCNSVHLPMPELSFQNDAQTCDWVSSFPSTAFATCLPCYFSSLTSSTPTVSTKDNLISCSGRLGVLCCVRSRPYLFFNVTRCLCPSRQRLLSRASTDTVPSIHRRGKSDSGELSELPFRLQHVKNERCGVDRHLLPRTFFKVYFRLPSSSTYIRCMLPRCSIML
jgi:hypothetical protein